MRRLVRSRSCIGRIGFLLALLLNQAAGGSIFNVPADYPQIQEAIDAAAAHDTVLIQPGTYYEAIDFLGKEILVTGVAPADTLVARETVIDASRSDWRSVVSFAHGEERGAMLSALTLTGGVGTLQAPLEEVFASDGGGIYCRRSSPWIRNCIIRGNVAYENRVTGDAGRGGGVFSRDGEPLLQGCIIEENHAEIGGSGVYLASTVAGMPELWGCLIRHNGAPEGNLTGAVRVEAADIRMEACAISFNQGIGVTTSGLSHSIWNDCRIIGNSRGGMFMNGAWGKLEGCTLAYNYGEAQLSGGLSVYYPVEVDHCTIFGNGDSAHPAIDAWERINFHSSIIRGHRDRSIRRIGCTVRVSFCNIEGGWSGEGNIDVDPRFCSTECNLTEPLYLAADSPCLGSGEDGSDIGAYPQGCDLPDPPHEATVLRIPREFATPEEALYAACRDDTLLFAPGTYTVSDLLVPAIGLVLRSVDPLDTMIVRSTVLRGSDRNKRLPAIRFGQFRGHRGCRLLGMTIANGDDRGVKIKDCTTWLDYCAVVENRGGVAVTGTGAVTIRHSLLADNDARRMNGGAIYLLCDGVCEVSASVLRRNRANSGGGLFAMGDTEQGNIEIRNCLLQENWARVLGGGIELWSDAKMENCLLLDNRARRGGGASMPAESALTNCTLLGNRAWEMGGAVDISGFFTESSLSNCIFWGNLPSPVSISQYAKPAFRYCDDEGKLHSGSGNISIDPKLVSGFGFQALLAPGSPCIDAGDPELHDQISDWHPRWPPLYPDGPRSDMGAYGGVGNSGNLAWLRWGE
jgi:hypothetical protein